MKLQWKQKANYSALFWYHVLSAEMCRSFTIDPQAGTMVIGQRRARDHLNGGKTKGHNSSYLSILTNDCQLKQISKTIMGI